MSNKQQTAVEWFASQLYEQMKGNDELFTNSLIQAKEMEKEQIIDAYKFGIQDEYVIGSEQYYKETYTHSINTVK
jgi:hypothetical protein